MMLWIFIGLIPGLILGWYGNEYWRNRQALTGGTEKPQGGGSHGEE